jgi:hypothetical protein
MIDTHNDGVRDFLLISFTAVFVIFLDLFGWSWSLIAPNLGLYPEPHTFFGLVVILVTGFMDPKPDIFLWNTAHQS